MRFAFAALLAANLLWISPACAAQDGIRSEQVRFPAGSTGTTIRDRIIGRESVSYSLAAAAGQLMTITLKPSNAATYFNVYEPDRAPGDQALAVSEITGSMVPEINRFRATLPRSGVYTISVYLVRAAARRKERSDYTLDIAVSPQGTAAQLPSVEGDFADGLEGGPDYWEVTGVGAGDALNMRRGPSTREAIIMSFADGSILRNKGCRIVDGRRWCKVERPDNQAVQGWVAGRYLRESNYTGAPVESSTPDALVPGTRFNATGSIPCARSADQPMTNCQFGVIRNGIGRSSVTVFWPDGGSRVIFFEGGKPTNYDESEADAGATMTVVRNSDLFTVKIGGQRFEIPEAVISGG